MSRTSLNNSIRPAPLKSLTGGLPRRVGMLVALITLPAVGWLAHASGLGATGSQVIPYNGTLELDGIAVDGARDISFYLFDYPAPAGSPDNGWLWSETHLGVQISSGQFKVPLGSVHSLGDHIASASDLYLEIGVVDPVSASEIRLSGRQRLGAVPFAYASAPGHDFVAGRNLRVSGHYLDANDDGWLRVRDGDGGAFKALAAGDVQANGTLHTTGDAQVDGNLQVGGHYLDANDDGWLRVLDSDNGAYKDVAVGNMWVGNQMNGPGLRNSLQIRAGGCPAGWSSVGSWSDCYYWATPDCASTYRLCVRN